MKKFCFLFLSLVLLGFKSLAFGQMAAIVAPIPIRPTSNHNSLLVSAHNHSQNTALDPSQISTIIQRQLSPPQFCALARVVEPSEIFIDYIPVAQGHMALPRIQRSILTALTHGECTADKTLFAYDIDETVLKTLITGEVEEIRNSAKALREIQALGVSTLAITTRDAITQTEEDQHALDLVRAEDMPDGFFPVALDLDPTRFPWQSKVHEVQYHLMTVGIDPGNGASAFNTGSEFFDLTGQKSKSEGFFSLYPPFPMDITQIDRLSDAAFQMHYGQGVLMTSRQNKGLALQHFLMVKGLTDRYSCIFFADDRQVNILNINDVFERTYGKKVFLFKVPDIQFL